MGVEIRHAVRTDASRLAWIHVASWRLTHERLYPQEVLDTLSFEEREESWHQTLETQRADRAVLVAERDKSVVGFVTYGPARDPDAPDDQAEIYELFVDPEAIGSGVGHALFRESLARLRAKGFRSVTLWVVDANDLARRFYEKEGFVHDCGSSRPDTLGGVGVVEVRYRAPVALP